MFKSYSKIQIFNTSVFSLFIQEDISEFIMEQSSYVPRINQLDAETLDEEFISDFNDQISNAFRLFLR